MHNKVLKDTEKIDTYREIAAGVKYGEAELRNDSVASEARAISPGPQETFRLGRFRLDALTFRDLLEVFAEAIKSRSKIVVLHHNLHGFYTQQVQPDLLSIYDKADWVYVDGMPLVWLARAAGFPLQTVHRITMLDCFEEFLAAAAENQWRVFYFGGKQEVLAAGLALLRERLPSLQISGCNGYHHEGESKQVLSTIASFKPDILLVGLGMPLQERWVSLYTDSLDVPVITTCGATMEYLTGHSAKPPRWAADLGLYGIMRLVSQPKRLWKRYLLEPLLLAPALLSAVLKQRLHGSRRG